jgi:hypothetical protein
VDAGEVPGEIEMLQDGPGVVVRLGGGDEQPASGGAERLERRGHAVIDDGVVHTAAKIALAVVGDGLFRAVRTPQELGKRHAQRRPDHPQQLVGRRHRMPELVQRILDGTDQPRLGIDQCAVEIDEDIHGSSASSPSPHLLQMGRGSG